MGKAIMRLPELPTATSKSITFGTPPEEIKGLHWDSISGVWRVTPAAAWKAGSSELHNLAVRVTDAMANGLDLPMGGGGGATRDIFIISQLKAKLWDDLQVKVSDSEAAAIQKRFGERIPLKRFVVKLLAHTLKDKEGAERRGSQAPALSPISALDASSPGNLNGSIAKRKSIIKTTRLSLMPPPTPATARTAAATAEKLMSSEEVIVQERRSAMAKLRSAATMYSSRGYADSTPEMKAVKDAFLPPPALAHLLLHTFNIRLTPGELAALFQVFDADGNGVVDGAEFLSLFFKMTDEVRLYRLRAQRVANFKRNYMHDHNILDSRTINSDMLHGSMRPPVHKLHSEGYSSSNSGSGSEDNNGDENGGGDSIGGEKDSTGRRSSKKERRHSDPVLTPSTAEEQMDLWRKIGSHSADNDLCTINKAMVDGVRAGGGYTGSRLRALVHDVLGLKLTKRESETLLQALDGESRGVEGKDLLNFFVEAGEDEKYRRKKAEKRLAAKQKRREQRLQNESQTANSDDALSYTDADLASAIKKLSIAALRNGGREGNGAAAALKTLREYPAPLDTNSLKKEIANAWEVQLTGAEARSLLGGLEKPVVYGRELAPFLLRLAQRRKKPADNGAISSGGVPAIGEAPAVESEEVVLDVSDDDKESVLALIVLAVHMYSIMSVHSRPALTVFKDGDLMDLKVAKQELRSALSLKLTALEMAALCECCKLNDTPPGAGFMDCRGFMRIFNRILYVGGASLLRWARESNDEGEQMLLPAICGDMPAAKLKKIVVASLQTGNAKPS